MHWTLTRGWQVLRRHPELALVPILWDAAVYGFANEWLGVLLLPDTAPGLAVRPLLPPSLPEGGQLIGYHPALHSPVFDSWAITLVILLTVANGYVRAGYLYLLSGTLQGDLPTWFRFTEGAGMFGRTLAGWQLLWLACGLGAAFWGRGPLPMALLIGFYLIFYLVEFLVILEEKPLLRAMSEAPGRLVLALRSIAPAVGAALVSSTLISLVLSASGLKTLGLATPLWAWFGTASTLSLLASLGPGPEQG